MVANGMPTWDPVTQQIHNSDGTNRGAPVTAATYNGPDVFTAREGCWRTRGSHRWL